MKIKLANNEKFEINDKSINDIVTELIEDIPNVRYSLESYSPEAGEESPSHILSDRTITNIVVPDAGGQTGAEATLSLRIPPATNGYARDFVVRLDVPESGGYTVDFKLDTDAGGNPISVEVEDDSGEFPQIENGVVNVYSFTEMAQGLFLVSKKNVYIQLSYLNYSFDFQMRYCIFQLQDHYRVYLNLYIID